MIPEAAIDAARDVLYENDRSIDIDYATLTAALEAAAPHMLAGVAALADEWEADGEEIMALSKRLPDKREATMCLMEGATMVENARLIRNAIGAAK